MSLSKLRPTHETTERPTKSKWTGWVYVCTNTVSRRMPRFWPCHRWSFADHNIPANALRDYQYMSQLPPLPSTFAIRQRTELERVFGSLAQPNPQQMNTAAAKGVDVNARDRNVPYDNQYLSLNPKPTQRPDPVREFLRIYLPRHLSWTQEERSVRRADYSQSLPPEMYSRSVDHIARFLVGIVGGACLIVPLLIMAFHSSLSKTMITVCTAVVLFSLAVSLLFELDNKDTVTATATYAAVLVVFVGTSTSRS